MFIACGIPSSVLVVIMRSVSLIYVGSPALTEGQRVVRVICPRTVSVQ